MAARLRCARHGQGAGVTVLERERHGSVEAVLEDNYESLRATVLSRVRGRLLTRALHFNDADIDAAYNRAWTELVARLRAGVEIDNLPGALVDTTFKRTLDELRRQRLDRHADAIDVADCGVDPELDARLDAQTTLQSMLEGMREQLEQREAQGVALCLLHGLSRAEAAKQLDMPRRRFEKLMDRATRKVGRVAEVIERGDWCRERQSLIKAYALEVLDPEGERHALALMHLSRCPSCRQYARGLRGIAAIVPPVALPSAIAGSDGAARLLDKLNAAAAPAWETTAATGGSGATTLKQHLLSGYYRALDPTPLSAARPGAAATAIAGCLALGGGAATYCLEQGITPLGGVKAMVAPQAEKEPPESPRKVVEQPPAAPPVTAPTGQAEPAPQQPVAQPAPEPAPPPPTPPPPTPEQEFEPTSPAGGGSATGRSSAAPSEPAPAPSSGPGEFGGP